MENTVNPKVNRALVLEHFEKLAEEKRLRDKKKFPVGKCVSFIILAIFCLIWILPFFLMFAGSLRSHTDATFYPGEFFPPHSGFSVEMYKIILFNEFPEDIIHNKVQEYEIGKWLVNTCINCIGGTLIYLLIASFAAYAFTFLDWRFRDVIFYILVITLVVPGAATSIGNLQTVYVWKLNKLNYPFQTLALIIPGLGGVYGMYLIKTFFSSIPKDLIESAKMDGYSNLGIFFKIVLPLGKTVLYVQGLFGFMGGWNDLVWPQMLFPGTDNVDKWTLQVGMAYIINNSKTSDLIGAALASGVICLVPVLFVYILAQNKIIEGMTTAGIKR